MTRVRPRVLIVSPWPSFWSMGGGAGCSDEYETLRGFLDAGFDVRYVVPASDVDPAADPLTARARFTRIADPFTGVGGMPAPLRRFAWYARFAMRSRRTAVALARAERPHVVFGYTPYGLPACVAAARAAGADGDRARGSGEAASIVKLFGIRDLVVPGRPRALDWYTNVETVRAFRAHTTRLILLDDGTWPEEAAQRYGVRPPRLVIWPNGVNAEWAARTPERSRAALLAALGADPAAHVVLAVSRLVPYKRVDRIVRAAPQLVAALEGRPVALLIAGDGPERAHLATLAASGGAASALHFLGPVPHDEIADYLAAADVFVTTSEMTNAGIPTCEALVMGVPVVATRAGTTDRLVPEGDAGYVVEPDDTAALADRVARILRDPSLRARLSAGARRAADQRCVSWETRVGWEVALVRELAEEVDRRRAA